MGSGYKLSYTTGRFTSFHVSYYYFLLRSCSKSEKILSQSNYRIWRDFSLYNKTIPIHISLVLDETISKRLKSCDHVALECIALCWKSFLLYGYFFTYLYFVYSKHAPTVLASPWTQFVARHSYYCTYFPVASLWNIFFTWMANKCKSHIQPRQG